MSDTGSKPDYALLDRRSLTLGLFYPRRDLSPPPPGAADYRIEVEETVKVERSPGMEGRRMTMVVAPVKH